MQGVPYWRLSSLYFFYFAAVGVISPYWSVYLSWLGFAGAEIGVIVAIPMVTRVLAPNLWGWLADVSGQYLRVIQVGSLCSCVAFVGLFYRTDFWGIIFFTAVFTFFWNAILPQFEVVTLDALGANSYSYSRIRLWGSIGFIFTVVGLGVAFEYFTVGILPATLFIVLIFIALSALTLSAKRAETQFPLESKQFLRSFTLVVYAFLAGAFFLHLSHGAFYGFYSLFLLEHGYSNTSVGLLWSVGVIAEIVLFLKVPWILHRFSLRFCYLLSLMAAVLRWGLVSIYVDSPVIMILTQLFHSLTFALAHAVAMEFLRQKFPGASRGKAQAFYSALCFGGGGAVGALVSGLLWAIEPAYCFAAAAFLALCAFVIVFFGMLEDGNAKPIKSN